MWFWDPIIRILLEKCSSFCQEASRWRHFFLILLWFEVTWGIFGTDEHFPAGCEASSGLVCDWFRAALWLAEILGLHPADCDLVVPPVWSWGAILFVSLCVLVDLVWCWNCTNQIFMLVKYIFLFIWKLQSRSFRNFSALQSHLPFNWLVQQ